MSLKYIFSMFLIFYKSEPRRSYKHGSYKKRVYAYLGPGKHGKPPNKFVRTKVRSKGGTNF